MNMMRNSIHQSLENFKEGVNVNGIDEMWAADLIDMQAFSKENNGIKYLLTVIDIFSKFVWIISLKTENWTGSRKRIFENLNGTKT